MSKRVNSHAVAGMLPASAEVDGRRGGTWRL